MKISFHTLGCKVNAYESEAIWDLFQDLGYERVSFGEVVDVCVINTCTVTNQGDAKSRKIIRQAVQHSPDAIIVVMGCFTQLKGDEVLSIPGVKIVLGTNNRHLIPDYIQEYMQTQIPLNKVKPFVKQEEFEPLQIKGFAKHQRAFLKIQDGCNHFCSYCIIPYARGRVRSKAPNAVLQEAKALLEHDHKELILTGIHTGGYGEDFEGYDFADLLRDFATLEGDFRIRISSIEINELTDEVLSILQNQRFCPHLHIPLQSGSERILKLMNRKYSKAQYLDKITQIRSLFPDIAITTDVIVGFPSETETDFEEMMAFIETIGFSELHVFPYSNRSGTVASKMPQQIDQAVKKARVSRLLSLNDVLAKRYIQSQIGRDLDVVVETYQEGYLKGHSGNYLTVLFPGNPNEVGSRQRVRLVEEHYPESLAIRSK